MRCRVTDAAFEQPAPRHASRSVPLPRTRDGGGRTRFAEGPPHDSVAPTLSRQTSILNSSRTRGSPNPPNPASLSAHRSELPRRRSSLPSTHSSCLRFHPRHANAPFFSRLFDSSFSGRSQARASCFGGLGSRWVSNTTPVELARACEAAGDGESRSTGRSAVVEPAAAWGIEGGAERRNEGCETSSWCEPICTLYVFREAERGKQAGAGRGRSIASAEMSRVDCSTHGGERRR